MLHSKKSLSTISTLQDTITTTTPLNASRLQLHFQFSFWYSLIFSGSRILLLLSSFPRNHTDFQKAVLEADFWSTFKTFDTLSGAKRLGEKAIGWLNMDRLLRLLSGSLMVIAFSPDIIGSQISNQPREILLCKFLPLWRSGYSNMVYSKFVVFPHYSISGIITTCWVKLGKTNVSLSILRMYGNLPIGDSPIPYSEQGVPNPSSVRHESLHGLLTCKGGWMGW